MAERRLNRSQQSPKAHASLRALGPFNCDGRHEVSARRCDRGRISLRLWALGVCVALLFVGWPMLGYAQTQHPATSVGTGSFPDGVASNPVTNKIYVANQASASVTVVDGATNTTTTVPTGTTPHSVTVNSVTNKIYVANEGSNTVTVIDGESNTTTSVAIGTGPYAIALNSATNKIYVANEGSGTVTVIDGATNATTTIAVENLPGAVAVNQITNKIYVVNRCGSDPTCVSAGTVTVIDGATNEKSAVAAGIGSGALAVNATTNKVYVANFTSNTVTVIDGATNDTAEVAAAEPGSIAVNEVTNQIYVATGAKTVTVLDGFTNDSSTVSVGAESAAVTVNPVTNQVYLLDPTRNSVTVIDGATKNVSSVVAGNLLIAAALNPVTNQIYAATINSNNVTVIDGVSHTLNLIAVNPVVGLDNQPIADSRAKSGERSVSLNTAIAPVASPSGSMPEFTFTAASLSSAASSGAENVYFQLDSLQGPWIAAARNGEIFTGKPSAPLSSGAHILYAYTTDGQDPNSTGAPHGLVGTIGAQIFTSVAEDGPLTSIVPNSGLAGGPAFTLTVNGGGFVMNQPGGGGVQNSEVEWNGSIRVTTFVNSTQLTAAILASDIQTAGTAQVTVVLLTSISLPFVPANAVPAPETTGFGSLPFTILAAANPAPTASSLSPSSATAGGAAFTLAVTGTNFVSNVSVVQWNGVGLVTTFVSATQLTAAVPASDIATSGTASVTVFNPTPGGGTSAALTFTISAAANNPVPTASSLSPSSATAGGAAFTLTVTGANFISTSVVKWNGVALVTTSGSATQLTAAVPASDIATAGTASVTVFTGTPGGGTSGALTFTINAAANNPVPTASSLSPSSATAGGAGFTLTVTGTNFISGSVVKWNGVALVTTPGSATQLTAAVPASDIAVAGTASVTVFNTTPGGGTSGALTFTINAAANNPVPTLTTLQPSSATAAGASFTLTVTGTNFISGSVVKWNGVALVTTPGSATQLTAAVPASDIATAGTASVTVFNGTPGGGTSGALTFTINAAGNPIPTLTGLQPSTVSAGTAVSLAVTGTNFISSSVVKLNGTALATTFTSATQLTASVTAAAIPTSGTASVTVFNTTPGGGTSGALTFTIVPFSIPTQPAAQTVAAGQTANFTIPTAPAGAGPAPTLNFSATGLPTGAAASFMPSSVTAGTSTTMMVSTTSRTKSAAARKQFGPRENDSRGTFPMGLASLALLLMLAGFSFLSPLRKPLRRLAPVAALILVLVAVGYLAACSNSSSSGNPNGTPAGSYTIKVTVSSAAGSLSTNVTLNVQ